MGVDTKSSSSRLGKRYSLLIRGQGFSETAADSNELQALSHKDFVLVQAAKEGDVLHLRADSEQGPRIISIEVSKDPGYALYRK
ncbi:hypothetical protein [Paenibacillus sp. yr247]|uniref:hypothetical protein n=1 Tax=Paenibacillus sp. yr247 TaxID=1761880 RepID=UPI001C311C75|nr:hypothetical protein [Paenibacillus sp. yr247]